jgi:hypothetical protein
LDGDVNFDGDGDGVRKRPALKASNRSGPLLLVVRQWSARRCATVHVWTLTDTVAVAVKAAVRPTFTCASF